MKKIILIPDSFKGSLSSQTVCNIMEASVRRFFPQAEILSLPTADGGEGTVAAFLKATKGKSISVKVQGPLNKEVASFYGLLPNRTAIIEMAAAAGLPLVAGPLKVGDATTYGVGQLIDHALGQGATNIILGLGGSATNDGGCGAAAALGVKFYNSQGHSFIPTGSTLIDIAHIDISAAQKKLQNIRITAICDIENPLCGALGAVAVFAPQKGATPKQLPLLEAGLKNMAAVIKQDLGKEIEALPGAGAAGGMGAGVVAFFNAELQSGIKVILDALHFDTLLKNTDLVFTGEGCFDEQSIMGKVVCGIIKAAKPHGIPVICVVGGIKETPPQAYEMGLTAIFSINQLPISLPEAMAQSEKNLAQTMDNILRIIKLKE